LGKNVRKPQGAFLTHTVYRGHDHDLSGIRDVIGHVTIWFQGGHFLQVLHWHQVRISKCCRDYGPHIYWNNDLDLSGSSYVISHVTIRIPIGHFLLVVHWTQVSISSHFRDIWP